MSIGVRLSDKSSRIILRKFLDILKEIGRDEPVGKPWIESRIEHPQKKAYSFDLTWERPLTLGSIPKLRFLVILGWLNFDERANHAILAGEMLNELFPGVDIEMDVAKEVDLYDGEAGPPVEPG